MKNLITIILTLLIFYSHSQNKIKCIKSDDYKIISEGNLNNKNGNVSVCYNDYYFSFLTPETGLVTFKIEGHTRTKSLIGDKIVDSFINEDSDTELRGFYSVDISQGLELVVTINYPTTPNGHAIVIISKTWANGENASMVIKENKASIEKKQLDSSSLKVKQAMPAIELKTETELEVFNIVEENAEFPGGTVAMMKFIQQNTVYPAIVSDVGINGKCFLKFVVNENGDISNVEILKGVPGCSDCDNEAIRVVKLMPKWKPAKMKGQPVKSYFNLPFSFRKTSGQ